MHQTHSPAGVKRSGYFGRHSGFLAGLLLALAAGWPGDAEAYKWHHAGVDSSGGAPGQFTSLVLQRNGRAHASYFRFSDSEGSRNLRYASKASPTSPGSWTTTTVDPSASTGTYSSIALDKSDSPHIAYYDSEFADLKHAWYDSTQALWQREHVDVIGTVGQYTAIAVDTATSIIHLAYFDATAPGLKMARKAPGGLWTFHHVDLSGTVGLYNSITRSGRDIAYYDLSRGNLRHARRGGGTTWTLTTVDSVGDVGRHTSIATLRDRTYISYYDNTNKDLKFAEKGPNGLWTITVVDASGDVGQGSSLSIGPAERPAILYYDATNQNLKYAERFNGVWIRNTVATGGNVGRFASLRQNADDLPVGIYYDETQGKVRFTYGVGEVTSVGDPPPPPAAAISMGVRPRTNPARPPSTFDLFLERPATVSFTIFDIYGRLVRNLYEGPVQGGSHPFNWDGRDERGRSVGSGVYFATVTSGSGRASTRLVVVR